MKFKFRTTIITSLGLAACLTLGLIPTLAQQGGAPAGTPAGAARGGGGGRGAGGGGGFVKSNDPRVQNRTYHFADTNEDLPYCLFVSSKVSKDKKNPLIISLHGLGIEPCFMC